MLSREAEQQIQEHTLKQKAAQQQAANQCSMSMGAALSAQTPRSHSLLERVAVKRLEAEKEAVSVNTLRELEYLLEKNPDVARILELLDSVNLT